MLALVALLGVVGCFTLTPETSVSLTPPAPLFTGPAGRDVVQLYVAAIEQAVGDDYLGRELWELVDEQGIDDPLLKVCLEDNGLRIGTIGGTPPARLQRLITSERCCEQPRRIRLHAGNPTPIQVGSCPGACSFTLRQGGQATRVELEQAECHLEVTPTLGDRDLIGLRFVPTIRHGQPRVIPQAVRDPSGTMRWEMQMRQASETYSRLAWDLSVTSSEYILIGVRLRPESSLGRSFLIRGGAGAQQSPVQKLIVLRAARFNEDPELLAKLFEKAPPLALQAGLIVPQGAAEPAGGP